MPTFGLSDSGFLPKSLSVIREELREAYRAAFGASIDLGDRSAFGHFVGILSERFALLWELIERVYSSQDPDKASGVALEGLCTLTGTFRTAATHSTVMLTLTGTPATSVPAGSKASTESTAQEFTTNADATIAAVSAWVGSTVYLVGARVTNSDNVYECITNGTSAASGGPTGEDPDIADNDVHWVFVGAGTGAVDTAATAVVSGEVTGFAGDIVTRVSTVSGWTGVNNLDDADAGEPSASDEDLRLLREEAIAQAGTSSIDAIRAALVSLSNVISVSIFTNDTDVTDGDGMPPHSVEALVRGPNPLPSGFEQNVYDALLANVAAGIHTHGNTPGTATDSQGTSRVVKYSQPDENRIYVVIGVTYDAALFPSDGDDQIAEAIVTFGDLQKCGKDAVATQVAAQAFGVDGVNEVTYVGISTASISTPTTWTAATVYSIGNVVVNSGRVYRCTTGGTSAGSGGPTSTSASITDNTAVWAYLGGNITIAPRELATFDTSDISVTASAATP